MTVDDGHRRAQTAVRDGDAGRGRGRKRGADTGHDLERHAGAGQRQCFFATPTEHERVAALQTHHSAALPAEVDQQRVDLGLTRAATAGCFANVDELG